MKKIEIIQPEIFPKNRIVSGVTKRNINSFPPDGFSLSHIGISAAEFKKNMNVFADFLGIETSHFRFNHQIHSDRIVVAEDKQKIENADAIITNRPELVLFVKIADCAGILIYEPNVECIAAIHSGWKGTKQNITGKTIKELTKKYNAKPSQMLIYLTPMASAENYEVGIEFKELFPSDVLYEFNGKLYYDNRKMIISQLTDLGIKPENIEYSELCTIDNSDLHSFRRDKDKSGRMAAYICMKQK